jgi:Hint domain
MADGDSYSWIGGTAGTWGNAANWEDLTTGTVAATAPDITNAVTIGAAFTFTGVTISGTGSAASLTTVTNGSYIIPGDGYTIAADLKVGTMASSGTSMEQLNFAGGTIVGNNIGLGVVSLDPFASAFVLTSRVSGTGSVEVLTGGTLGLFTTDSAGSDITYQLDGNANFLVLGDISGGAIILNGAANTIDIATTYESRVNLFGTGTPQVSAPIEGFDTTDRIDFVNNTFTAAAYSGDTLTLTGTGDTQTLTLLGDYSGDIFQVAGGEVDVIPPTAHSYSWIGGTVGTWGNAANWEDMTAGTVAAVAPGIDNTATIDGIVAISGPGSAAGLTILGTEMVLGNLNAGTLVVGGTGSLTMNAGATVSAANATDSGAIVVNGTSAGLSVSGVLEIDQTALSVYDGGLVQAENVVLQGTSIVGTWLDPSDPHELINPGSAGVTAPPPEEALIIGTGGTVSGTGALYIQQAIGHLPPEGYGIVNNGVISSSALQIGQVLELFYVRNITEPRDISLFDTWYQTQLGATLSGTGSVDVLTGGTINVVAAVTGSETFQLNGTASLNLYGSVAAGSTILMNGGSDTINVSGTFDGINIGGTYAALGADPQQLLGPPAPPPMIGATIYGFDATDQIHFQGISFTVASYANGTLSLLEGTTSVGSLTLSGDYLNDIFSVTGTTVVGRAEEIVTVSPACFAAGTRIATPRGEIPVESLCPGDEVTLASGGTAPIVWIGRRRIDCRSHPAPKHVWPVQVRHSAFAPEIPCRDLFLSPDHAVFVEDVLIPIKYLTNGDTIQQIPRDTVEYFHLELPAHDLVLADGLEVESYLDTGDRSSFENAGRVITLFPEFSSLKWEAYGYAPLVVSGPPVEAARRRIEIQAQRRDSAPRRKMRRKAT